MFPFKYSIMYILFYITISALCIIKALRETYSVIESHRDRKRSLFRIAEFILDIYAGNGENVSGEIQNCEKIVL